jgi:hypothetical protein
LDSGLTTGHPLLAPAVGDAQSFLPGKDAANEHGHGTIVACHLYNVAKMTIIPAEAGIQKRRSGKK